MELAGGWWHKNVKKKYTVIFFPKLVIETIN
jgi:hypothetical protein